MELMNPNNLKPHPRNNEFFDDMDGQKWKDFLQSVKTSGIIEPIIVTQDLVIVSGHQRVRASKAIGLMKVAVEVRHYDSDDKVLKDLIETNIMQRGIGNTNPIKLAKCIVELERILGIRNGSANEKGNNRIGDLHNANDKVTQADLAEKLKVSQSQLSRYKKLLDLVPELQSAVESGQISATSANAVLAKLPEDEQKAIAEQIVGTDRKVSIRELEFYKSRVKELTTKNDELSNRKPEVVEKVVEKRVEVKPKDYEIMKNDYERVNREREQAIIDKRTAEERVRELEERNGEATLQAKLETEANALSVRVAEFIRATGGYVWITGHFNELPEQKRKEFEKSIMTLDAWAQQMIKNMRGE